MISFRDINTSSIEPPLHLLLKKNKSPRHSINETIIVRFIKDLSMLINASVPLVKSLEVLARQQKDKAFGTLINNLAISVHSGMPFSTSLTQYPKVFDILFINMVKAGEASCNLGEILERIAKYKEKELKLRKKIKSIMLYPCIVITIATLIVSLLFLFIIPKFESVFSTTLNETTLPWATHIIISISRGFQEISISLIAITITIFLILKFMKKEIRDKFILKIPITGGVVKNINIALFSRILGTLIVNGVPLIKALEVSENVASNHAIRNNLKKSRKHIEEGEDLSNTLKTHGNFPEIITGMIHIGEETGTLSHVLLEIANKLEDDIELTLESLTSTLEPLITLLLAVIIGSIVIALFLPIVNVMNNIIAM